MDKKYSYILFDADDTLWINENLFRDSEKKFGMLLQEYNSIEESIDKLYQVESRNISVYGYGVKSFVLSMMECAIEITGSKITPEMVSEILAIGREQLNMPVELIDGVEDALKTLQKHGVKLVLATKGDLMDQEKKLLRSGLSPYFDHIEIMSEKKPNNYLRIAKLLKVEPSSLLMIGNSIKSDIVPLLDIGADAIHIPSECNWIHEEIELKPGQYKFRTVDNISDLPKMLGYV